MSGDSLPYTILKKAFGKTVPNWLTSTSSNICGPSIIIRYDRVPGNSYYHCRLDDADLDTASELFACQLETEIYEAKCAIGSLNKKIDLYEAAIEKLRHKDL